MQKNPRPPEAADNHHTGIHWRTVIAACILGLLLAVAWAEVAQGGKGVMQAFWTLLR